jgi:hypothetical protein
MRGIRSRWHGRATKQELESIRGELSHLVEENARLRLNDQRTLSLLAVGAKAQATPEGLATRLAEATEAASAAGPKTQNGEPAATLLMPLMRSRSDADGEEALDEAWRVLAEAKVLQATVLAVLQDLQVACAQMERHLTTGAPSSEIDRRVVARRGVGLQRTRENAIDDPDEVTEISLPLAEISLKRGSRAHVVEESVEQR